MDLQEKPSQRKRRLANERKRRWMQRQSQESLDRIRDANAEAKRRRRSQETAVETQMRRTLDVESNRRAWAQETQMRREADTESRRRRKKRNSQRIREEAINNEVAQLHYCGPMSDICQFCGSKNFAAERPPDRKFNSCCRKGKVALKKPLDSQGSQLIYPPLLQDLLMNPENQYYKNFRDNVRSYNSALSFASMGAKVVNFIGRGPYVFKVHGQIFHKTSHIQPPNQKAPQYAQLYVIDSTQASEFRVRHPANQQCIPRLLDELDRLFRTINRLCHTYRMLRDVEAHAIAQANEAGENHPIVNLVFRRDRHSDQRRYNAPATNEIAMVFVNDDGEPPFDRDIRIYPVNPKDPQQQFVNINILSPNLDPMCYPILFPYGEPGWQPNWTCEAYDGAQRNRIRNHVTMLQYKTALTAIREDFNPIISAGRLTQQFIVDSYLQVEANNLNYIRTHQQKLRAELYQGLADHIENRGQDGHARAGIPVILPSTFEGSPRNMRERCADAMSIFAKFGPPDLFITFTANPKWREIAENLRQGEKPIDRPDLVSRVYNLKLRSILQDLTVNGVLGVSVAHVYTIEFQKRGLPHAHILIVIRTEDKYSTVERIDRFVSAEIPDPDVNPCLHEIVTRCMLHGPCGQNNPGAPCMQAGKCSKNFPKDYNNETTLKNNGYPSYRRRIGPTAVVHGVTLDNRSVVPYNAYLLQKYDAHINVEVCTSMRAVKYIYKYIYKGFDCANMILSAGEAPDNEIANYIDARYVSAPEAMWRLLQCKMHDKSHAVIRLPVHLPNQQRIIFREGEEEQALDDARTGTTKLEAWFLLNQTDPNAQSIMYTDIPYSYVYFRNTWQKRQRGGHKIVSRLYIVSVREEELFYLRILLLHVPGATSFEFLRTVDGKVYNTFKEAAFNRHLLESDDEWDHCLRDATVCQMPNQLRQTFAFILIFCNPTNSLQLWNSYCSDMSTDFMRDNDEFCSLNLALHDINATLNQHGLTCESFGLPVPAGNPIPLQLYNPLQQEQMAELQIASLNAQQLEAFRKIITATEDANEMDRYFFIDGPGGSGKTYLYSTLLYYIRGKRKVVLPFATTGIAATLLEGGRTVHSGFKLPVPILDTSVSSMRTDSLEAANLREAQLIIIDEITMLTKDGLRCIDLLLKEIMQNDSPFGGKVIVIGGDFRQTLPVLPRGSRASIIETCIKSSSLWRFFTRLTLTTNMRSAGQEEYNRWLLNVGEGTLPNIPGLPVDSIRIPDHMIEENIIDSIYTEAIATMQVEQLAERVILAPTNKKTLELNMKIICKLEGNPRVCYSVDSIISEDNNDVQNYPAEFLHEQTPSGMPPHKLVLKKGVIVMLLRNLNPKRGLCNGTRLSILELHENFISAKILSQCHHGDIVFLTRIDLSPSDVNLPFILKRRQFPIIPAYAMTINKSQGQTFQHVGIYLEEHVFSHGQLYVSLSRSRHQNCVKFYIQPNDKQGQIENTTNYFTSNVVFKEVF